MYTEVQLRSTAFAMAVILFLGSGLATFRLILEKHIFYAALGPVLFAIALGALLHALFIPSRRAFYLSQVTSVIVMVLTVMMSL